MPSIVKEAMLKEAEGSIDGMAYAFLSSFEGLNVAELSELRRNLEKVSSRSVVMKHTLAKKAFQGDNVTGLDDFLKGSVLVTVGDKEPQAASKAIVEFAKTNKKFAPSAVVLNKQVYREDFVKRLAQMPSRKELLTQVVVRVKSPISGVVLTLNQVLRGFVVALNEVKKKKESQTV